MNTYIITEPYDGSRVRNLVLVRSDAGDGGWSLHAPGSSDEQIASGYAPCLVSGTAICIGGTWDRPAEADYQLATTRLHSTGD